MKKEINVFEHVQDILQGVKSGVLLTTCSEGKANTMTISWGALGIEWGKPVFTTYVRESRFTREILDQTGEFTINIPYDSYDKNILAFCGSKSGRDVDKIKELNLTLEEGECVAAPAIRELPLTLECRVVYKQPQDVALLPAEDREKFYPLIPDDHSHTSRRDAHIAYYGEIVRAYLVE